MLWVLFASYSLVGLIGDVGWMWWGDGSGLGQSKVESGLWGSEQNFCRSRPICCKRACSDVCCFICCDSSEVCDVFCFWFVFEFWLDILEFLVILWCYNVGHEFCDLLENVVSSWRWICSGGMSWVRGVGVMRVGVGWWGEAWWTVDWVWGLDNEV